MQSEKNPFDRDPRAIPLIRFMLHSNSLVDEIMSQGSPTHRLIRLNYFKEIEVIPLPTNNSDLHRIFSENGLVSSEYHSHEAKVVLKLSNGSTLDVISRFIKRLPKNFWEQFAPDSQVTHADFSAADIGDYLVVGANEPSLKRKVARDNIITAEQALEMVRIILTAHGRFCLNAEAPISEWFYYVYRFNKLFKSFHYARIVATDAKGKSLSEKIHDRLLSLGTRLEFICKAYDKVSFFSLKTANYYDLSNQLYHLAFFVMLITGVFDDLAHIIKEFYHIQITGRMNISLRIPDNNKEEKQSKYFQLFQSANATLHEFLIRSDIQRNIKTFYPIRDSLQHREFPTGTQLHEVSEPGKNVFELSNDTIEELNEKYKLYHSEVPTFIIRGNPCFLNPLPFIKWAQEVTITLVNRVLSYIDWDSVCVTLPKDIQDKIHTTNENYEQKLGQALGLPEDPLCF